MSTPSVKKKALSLSWSVLLASIVLVGLPQAMLTPKFGSISPAAMRITAIRNAKTLIEISESKPPLPGESKETYVSRLLADNKASKHFRSIQIQAIIDELQLVDGKLSLITITKN